MKYQIQTGVIVVSLKFINEKFCQHNNIIQYQFIDYFLEISHFVFFFQ